MCAATVTQWGLQAPLCRHRRHGIRLRCVGSLFEACEWLERWSRWCFGLGLRPFGMGLRSGAFWPVSFWMAFHGYFVELASTVGNNVEIY
jgi:hypothetical protein